MLPPARARLVQGHSKVQEDTKARAIPMPAVIRLEGLELIVESSTGWVTYPTIQLAIMDIEHQTTDYFPQIIVLLVCQSQSDLPGAAITFRSQNAAPAILPNFHAMFSPQWGCKKLSWNSSCFCFLVERSRAKAASNMLSNRSDQFCSSRCQYKLHKCIIYIYITCQAILYKHMVQEYQYVMSLFRHRYAPTHSKKTQWFHNSSFFFNNYPWLVVWSHFKVYIYIIYLYIYIYMMCQNFNHPSYWIEHIKLC